MRGWISVISVLAVAVALSACGSAGPRQDGSEPDASFPVVVTVSSFPTSQSLAQHTRMVIRVRNAGSRAIPNLAVSVCPVSCGYPAAPGHGSSSAVFGSNTGWDSLNNPATPPWIVDRPPGPCSFSCRNGGAGAYATANPNTWALGQPLAPGRTATFIWGVTPVQAGRFIVAWEIAAGLNGKAKAVLAGGGTPQGRFAVTVSNKPTQAYVNNAGQIITTP